MLLDGQLLVQELVINETATPYASFLILEAQDKASPRFLQIRLLPYPLGFLVGSKAPYLLF